MYWILEDSPTFTVSGLIVIPVAGTVAFAVTVTVHSLFTFGSSVVTSITTVPSFTPVTLPSASTVAVSVSREVNVSAAVAPSGWSVYWILEDSPTFTVSDSTVILVAGIAGFAVTVTLHSPFTFGLSVVTSITTVPTFTPVTLPSASTVAVSVSREVNVSAAVAPSGVNLQVIFDDSPTFTVSGSTVILVAGGKGVSVTVTAHSPFTVDTSVVTSIITNPAFTPVTLPLASTVAIFASREVNVTLEVASAGSRVYLILLVWSTATVNGETVMLVAGICWHRVSVPVVSMAVLSK